MEKPNTTDCSPHVPSTCHPHLDELENRVTPATRETFGGVFDDPMTEPILDVALEEQTAIPYTADPGLAANPAGIPYTVDPGLTEPGSQPAIGLPGLVESPSKNFSPGLAPIQSGSSASGIPYTVDAGLVEPGTETPPALQSADPGLRAVPQPGTQFDPAYSASIPPAVDPGLDDSPRMPVHAGLFEPCDSMPFTVAPGLVEPGTETPPALQTADPGLRAVPQPGTRFDPAYSASVPRSVDPGLRVAIPEQGLVEDPTISIPPTTDPLVDPGLRMTPQSGLTHQFTHVPGPSAPSVGVPPPEAGLRATIPEQGLVLDPNISIPPGGDPQVSTGVRPVAETGLEHDPLVQR